MSSNERVMIWELGSWANGSKNGVMSSVIMLSVIGTPIVICTGKLCHRRGVGTIWRSDISR